MRGPTKHGPQMRLEMQGTRDILVREIGLLIENPFRRSLQLTQCTDALGREIDETLALHR